MLIRTRNKEYKVKIERSDLAIDFVYSIIMARLEILPDQVSVQPFSTTEPSVRKYNMTELDSPVTLNELRYPEILVICE